MFKIAIAFSVFMAAALPSRAAEGPMFPACNECHSKDPKMVRMHSALGFKGCFSCHGPAATAIDRTARATDLRCMPCHK